MDSSKSSNVSRTGLPRSSCPDPERKWLTDVCWNFTKFGFDIDLHNAKKRNRDRQVGLIPRGKAQGSSNRRGSSNVSPSVVLVHGTPKSGFHENPTRGSGEKSDDSIPLLVHERGAGSVPCDTEGAKRST